MSTIRKNSKKRNAILELLHSTTAHPNADWIYAQLKPMYPDLSLGTIYRNLALFKEEGQIISVGTVNGQERFDGNLNPHTHFICEKCGRIEDIMMEPTLGNAFLSAVDTSICGVIHSHRHTVYGLCRDCCDSPAQDQAS